MSTYVIGDIHGCYAELQDMLSLIGFNDKDQLILIGDYIDRGKQSYEMCEWLLNTSNNIITLIGNHEKEFIAYVNMMIDINEREELHSSYNSNEDSKLLYDSCLYYIKKKNPLGLLYFDAYGTIYDFIFNKSVPIAKLLQYSDRFLIMPYLYRINNIVCVHAGFIDSECNLGSKYNSLEDFYLYARSDAYKIGGCQDGVIIAGHTPTIEKSETCYNDGDIFHYYNPISNCNYYNIDGGIVFRDEDPSAQLCCLRLDDMKEYYI